MMRGWLSAICVALALMIGAGPGIAQQVGGVVILDPERVFAETLLGQSFEADLQSAREALIAENLRLDTELSAEESALAEQRTTLPVDEFRVLAEEFDAKVERIRAEQVQKVQDLSNRREQARAAFFNQIMLVVQEQAIASNASVILDARSVFLAVEGADITDDVIAELDRRFEDDATE